MGDTSSTNTLSVYGTASYPYNDTGDYLSPSWVDFRVNIYGPSGDSGVIVWFYLIHTCTTPLFIMLGLFLIYKKVIVPRSGPYRWTLGSLVPRATEGWLLCSTTFLILRWVYGTLLLTNKMQIFAAREFMHDIAWFILYNGGVLYTFALVHGTTKKERRNKVDTRDVGGIIFVPSAIMLNTLYFIYSLSAALPVTLATISGYFADQQDYPKARLYVQYHYISWSALCTVFCTLLLFFGVQLVRILRYNMEVCKADNQDSQVQETLRNSMTTVKLMMVGLFGMGFIFATMLGCYAGWRSSIHGIYGVQYTLGFIWIFNAPLLIFLTHFAIALNIWRVDRSKPSEEPSMIRRTNSTISSTAMQNSTYTPMKLINPVQEYSSQPSSRNTTPFQQQQASIVTTMAPPSSLGGGSTGNPHAFSSAWPQPSTTGSTTITTGPSDMSGSTSYSHFSPHATGGPSLMYVPPPAPVASMNSSASMALGGGGGIGGNAIGGSGTGGSHMMMTATGSQYTPMNPSSTPSMMVPTHAHVTMTNTPMMAGSMRTNNKTINNSSGGMTMMMGGGGVGSGGMGGSSMASHNGMISPIPQQITSHATYHTGSGVTSPTGPSSGSSMDNGGIVPSSLMMQMNGQFMSQLQPSPSLSQQQSQFYGNPNSSSSNSVNNSRNPSPSPLLLHLQTNNQNSNNMTSRQQGMLDRRDSNKSSGHQQQFSSAISPQLPHNMYVPYDGYAQQQQQQQHSPQYQQQQQQPQAQILTGRRSMEANGWATATNNNGGVGSTTPNSSINSSSLHMLSSSQQSVSSAAANGLGQQPLYPGGFEPAIPFNRDTRNLLRAKIGEN